MEEWEDSEEKKVDLVELVQHVWRERLFIAKVAGVFAAIGLLIALLSPVEYETGATLMPEAQQQGMAGSLIEQYGGLLGMGGGSMSIDQDATISPQLYPQIIRSLPFQLELLNKSVAFATYDTTATVHDFFDEIHSPSVFSYISAYTVGLPWKIKGLFTGNDELKQPLPEGFQADSVVSVSKAQLRIIENMRERITVTLDEETNTIDLNVVMPDPNAAAELGKESINLIKEYVTLYRTRKAQEDLEYAENQLQDSRERFEDTQNRLAEFRDSNMNLATAKAQTQEERLLSEYELAFNVYNSLAQQVEQSKLKVQEQTPVVSILQPVQMPIDKSSPQRTFILLASIFLGVAFATAFSLLRPVFSQGQRS